MSLVLDATTDKIQVVLASAITTNQLPCISAWRDITVSNYTPGKTLVMTNSTTDADLVGSPAASTQRVVLDINIYNADTVSAVVTVKFDANGTEYILRKTTLGPGESLQYTDQAGWQTFNAAGVPTTGVGAGYTDWPNYGVAGSLAETLPRHQLDETNTALLSTGRLSMQAIWLRAGMIVGAISISSATTAGATLTNQIFGLFDASRNLLATTVDGTSGAWAANTVKKLAISSPYTVPTTGLYYIGIMVAATTVPTIKGQAAPTGGTVRGTAPIIGGTSTTGLTTALPNPAGAITMATTSFWASVSAS